MADHRKREWRPVFVVGSPRSGTTWVQSLLDCHPEVATCRETHLFSGYIEQLRDRWRFDDRRKEQYESYYRVGLPTVLGRDEFLDLCGNFAEEVLHRVAGGQVGRTDVVVEKTPHHARCADLILELFPEARFVHVIRDPRAVVASLRKASQGWGHYWTPDSTIDSIRLWKKNVECGREIADLTPRYMELSYETLHDETLATTRTMFDWMGLDSDDEFCAEAVEACRLDELEDREEHDEAGDRLGPAEGTPEGFFRKGAKKGWRRDLGNWQIGLVEHMCREEMEELGYDRTGRDRLLPRLILTTRRTIERVRGGVDWRLERLARQM